MRLCRTTGATSPRRADRARTLLKRLSPALAAIATGGGSDERPTSSGIANYPATDSIHQPARDASIPGSLPERPESGRRAGTIAKSCTARATIVHPQRSAARSPLAPGPAVRLPAPRTSGKQIAGPTAWRPRPRPSARHDSRHDRAQPRGACVIDLAPGDGAATSASSAQPAPGTPCASAPSFSPEILCGAPLADCELHLPNHPAPPRASWCECVPLATPFATGPARLLRHSRRRSSRGNARW